MTRNKLALGIAIASFMIGFLVILGAVGMQDVYTDYPLWKTLVTALAGFGIGVLGYMIGNLIYKD